MKKHYLPLLLLFSAAALSAQTTFNYTGGVQTYTVPACVTSITVDVYGAAGGSNNSIAGGLGGRVQATVAVTPGEVLQIFVGQVGASTQTSNAGVYNGGGGVYSYVSNGTSGTGGGASDIRRSPYGNADRLVIAGGGGGGGYTNVGGHGGGLVAMDGVPYPSWPNSGGKGGNQIAGGQQGVACCSCPTYTTAGAIAQGGNGAGDGAGGGGGGGGYFGGGGSCFAGGGGGSSYTIPSATGVTHTQGVQNGNGMVTITGIVGSLATPTGFIGSATVCAGSTGSYSITAVGGATSYTWTVPPGATINSGQGTTAVNVTFGSTSGTITVTADNVCGSSSPLSQTITVNSLPTVALGSDITQCGGTALLDAGNAGSTFVWSDNSTQQTLTASSSGTYSVIVTNAGGCSSTDQINVTIHSLPTVALGSDVTQCGGSATLDAGNPGSTYLWSNSTTNQTLLVTSSGTYMVTVTDANGCTGSDIVTVTINTIPTVTASAANILPCVADAPVALTGTPAGGTWSGTAVAGNTFDPAVAGVGSHVLVYTYVDSLTTCTDTAQLNITVDVCLGIDNSSAGNISVFPNPVADQLQVQTVQPLVSYSIMDINGREVLTGNFAGNSQNKIDVTELAAGTYVLRTTDNSGTVQNIQFVKE